MAMLTQRDRDLILSVFGLPEVADRIIQLLNSAGTGDVSGPGSSADTAIPRFSGTTGTVLQGSGVLVDSSNNITGSTSIALSQFLQLTEIASPTNPGAGQHKVYFKVDGELYKKTSGGVETAVGNVAGAASASDNAVVRFDGITGKILQNSSVTIADSGLLTITSGDSSARSLALGGDILTTGQPYWIGLGGSIPDAPGTFGGAFYGISTTGTTADSITGHYINMGPGYSGSGSTIAFRAQNNVEATGPIDLFTPAGNFGILAEAYAFSGEKVGTYGFAFAGSKLIGSAGVSAGADAAAVALGHYGAAQLPVGGTAAGGYFKIHTTDVGATTFTPSVSAAIIADNGDTVLDIAAFQVAGSTVARVDVDGNFATNVAGVGFKIKEGANARMGTATLVGGTVTISNTSVTANTRIFYSISTAGGVQGFLSTTQSAGVSFTINSSSVADTSSLVWELKEPA